MFKVMRYSIKKHAKGFQSLFNQHMIPLRLKRMGLTPDQQLQYIDIEPVLDPNAAYDKKHEDFSIVFEDNENGNLIGCQTNYLFPKQMIYEDIKGLQKIVGQNEGGLIHEYCKYRLKMCTDIANIIETYPRIDKVFYMKSTIVDPKWRGKLITSKLHEESLKVAGPKELVILKGRMPKERWGISTKSTVDHLKMGFEVALVNLTYDDYACPIFVRPPLNN